MGTYLKKPFWFVLDPRSPQAEYKEDDEYFANHLQIYLSMTFIKAKKFLKIEEVEYLIHFVKFQIWPALFM